MKCCGDVGRRDRLHEPRVVANRVDPEGLTHIRVKVDAHPLFLTLNSHEVTKNAKEFCRQRAKCGVGRAVYRGARRVRREFLAFSSPRSRRLTVAFLGAEPRRSGGDEGST